MNNGTILLRLKPRSERAGYSERGPEVAARPQPVPRPARFFVRVPPAINIGGRSSRALYQYVMFGPDMEQLFDSAQKIESGAQKIAHSSGCEQRSANQESRKSGLQSIAKSGSAWRKLRRKSSLPLQSAYGSREISTIYAPNNDYKVLWNCRNASRRISMPPRASMCGRENGSLRP